MSTHRNPSSVGQKGVSLVISLILLLVLTIVGIASMNTSLMQERMAGNVNLQTLAFEAASAGIVDSLDFLDTSAFPECRRGAGWGPTVFQEFQQLDGLAGSPPLPPGIRVGYQLRAGCFEPDVAVPEWEDWEEDIPLQLLVLSRGVVCRGATCNGANLADENVLAVREVEVRVSPIGGGDPACLLNVGPLAAGAIGVGKSGTHLVDGGEGGCPIEFADSIDADQFTDDLGGEPPSGSSRVGQYQPRPPGITSAEVGSRGLWEDEKNLARAVNAIKVGVRAYSTWEAGSYIDPNPFVQCAGQFQPNSSFPGPITGAPGVITYVAGELDTAGMSKGTISNSIVFVEGPLDISGTTPYQSADFVALGGSFNASGWGKARNSGLIYLEKLGDRDPEDPSLRVSYDPNNAAMQDVDLFNISGFGNARITADDCDVMQARWIQLNECIKELRTLVSANSANFECGGSPCISDFHHYINTMGFEALSDRTKGQADDFDVPELIDNDVEFDIPNCGGPAGETGTRNVITSWREYIDRVRWE